MNRGSVWTALACAAGLPFISCAARKMPAIDGATIEVRRSTRSGGTEASDGLELWWFGSGCHLIRFGGVSVLTDPFVSNGANLVFPKSNGDKVGATFGNMSPPDVVVVNHGHVDHLLDTHPAMMLPDWEEVPLLAGRTTCNILAGWKGEEDISGRCRTIPCAGGTIYRKNSNGTDVRIDAYRTEHGPHLDCGLVLFDGDVKEPRDSPPAWQGDFKSGEVFNFLITFTRGDASWRVFYLGGITDLAKMPGCLPPAGMPIDAAILCVPGHDKVDGYPTAHLDRMRPRHIVLGHFNNFFKDTEDEQVFLAGVDFARTTEMSREVQRFFAGNKDVYPEFEAMHIPSVTVMDGPDQARNVIRIGKR